MADWFKKARELIGKNGSWEPEAGLRKKTKPFVEAFVFFLNYWLFCDRGRRCLYPSALAVALTPTRFAQSVKIAAEMMTPGTIGWIAPRRPGAARPVSALEVEE